MKKIAVFAALAVVSGSLMAAPLNIRGEEYRPISEGARYVQQNTQSGPQYNAAGARVNYKTNTQTNHKLRKNSRRNNAAEVYAPESSRNKREVKKFTRKQTAKKQQKRNVNQQKRVLQRNHAPR